MRIFIGCARIFLVGNVTVNYARTRRGTQVCSVALGGLGKLYLSQLAGGVGAGPTSLTLTLAPDLPEGRNYYKMIILRR